MIEIREGFQLRLYGCMIMTCDPFSHDWKVEEVSSMKEEYQLAENYLIFRCSKCFAKVQGMIER